jgi:hypothetical protein
MTKDDDCERWASFECAAAEGSRGADDEEEAPVLDPEYGDLLDTQWLGRDSDALDPEDDLVDIGLTIDMAGADDQDEAQAVELDVGALLTSLPGYDLESSDLGEPEQGEAAAGGELHGLLLPEERGRSREDDDAVGDDERFPAFDGVAAPGSAAPPEDDAEGPHEV